MASEDPRKRKIFNGDSVKVYDYFKDEFFGMENVIEKLMRFMKGAALRGEESRQVLLLMGPVGAGKSALTEHIKRALDGQKYYHLKDDPQKGEPLQLIPRSLRADFEKMLNVKIEGDISPIARWKLLEDYKGKYEDFQVVESTFSQRGRRGIASVPPMDANSQDVSVLIGSEDISKLDKYSEDDPRVLNLTGAFNIGNRGIVELVEVFKKEIETTPVQRFSVQFGDLQQNEKSMTQAMTSSTISASCNALRHRICNISFNNTTEINSNIYFCRVPWNRYNYSTNPTYLSGAQIRVKNIASDSPISYITTIGMYNLSLIHI